MALSGAKSEFFGSGFNFPCANILQRVFSNSGILLFGMLLAGVAGLGSLTLAGRAIGAEKLGVLAMMQAYVLLVDRLVNFQSWQSVVSFGAKALAEPDSDEFKSLVKFTLLLDFFTAVFGAFLAASGVYFVGRLRGWSDEAVMMTGVYSLAILFNLRGTPTGVLKLFNSFRVISAIAAGAAFTKLLFVLGAFFTTRNIWAYLLIWVGVNIFESLLTVFFGFLALSNKGYRNIFRVPLRLITRRHAGLWRFVLSTNFNQSVRLASRELDVLVIGAILGAASTGVYKVAKHFASILPKLIDPVYQTIYPEFASLAAQKRFSDMKSVGVMVSVITGACGVFLWFVFVLFGKWFLAITAGPDYVSGWSVMVLIMFGYVIWGFAFCLPAGLLAIGRAERNLFVQLVSLSVFFPSLIFLLYRVGLFGAGIGQIIFFIVYFNLMLFFFSKNISRLEGAIID